MQPGDSNCSLPPKIFFLQMRPSFVVSLMILSLLLTKAQGIRMEKGSLAVQQQKHQDEEITMLKRSNSDAEEAILCKEEQCKGKIKNRKLVTTSVSTTHTISKNVKNGGNEAHPPVKGNTRNMEVNGEAEEIKVNTLATSKHQELPHEHYPDLVDIAEMDYSPARRKPPIHN